MVREQGKAYTITATTKNETNHIINECFLQSYGKRRSSTRAAADDSLTFQTEKKLLYFREVLYSETVLYAACSSN